MADRTNYILKSKGSSKLVLLLSIAVFIFYLSVNLLIENAYGYAIVGALFELLSVPMFLLLISLPVVSLIRLIGSKGAEKSYAIASFTFTVATIWMLTLTAP